MLNFTWVRTIGLGLLMTFSYGTTSIADNYEESKVPAYTLPDLLTMSDGSKVVTARQWTEKRRGELLELFATHMYGHAPGPPAGMTFRVFDNDPHALMGKGTRRQITIFLTGDKQGPQLDLLLFLPNQAQRPVPVFLGLNFQGNQAVHPDPAIRLSDRWMASNARGVVDHRATEASRGATASHWPVETILAHGYGLATVYCGDIDPDYDDGFKNGVHALYPALQQRGDNFSTMGAWAWGLSRALDCLERDHDVDAKRVAVYGFSRLGKAALWAGARDTRFAMVISNESGAGGAALARRQFGERIERLNRVFPHWFCQNFRQYNNHEDRLPVDQHMLIALIAPRPVYIASARDDLNSDPRGEFLAAKGANPAYKLFGFEGLPADEWPAVDHPVHGRIGYHVRAGGHDVTPYDWAQYLKFADRYWSR